MSNQKATFVVTGRVRFSYPHLFQPHSNIQGQEPRYSLTILIPKSDTATKAKIDAACAAAVQEGIANRWNGVQPPQLRLPVQDGDGVRQNGEAFGQECKGHWVINTSSKQPPQVVDASGNPIMVATDVYGGCYGRASINFFAYNNTGNRGVGAGLGNVQKLEDGEPLGGGRTTAAEDFGAAPAPAAPAYQAPAAPAYQPPVQPPYLPPTGTETYAPYAPPSGGINPITGAPM